ncbi:MAG: GerMN domain-containing protein [Leptospiraceae bacterium]|nr:GerMN domain-containing protein [Leptospiraceae bacterium]
MQTKYFLRYLKSFALAMVLAGLFASCSQEQAQKPEAQPPGPATIKIFMSVSGGADCTVVEPLERKIESNTPEAALKALLEGPTTKETLEGAYSAIDRGTKLLSIKEEGQTIIADFSSIPDSDSCRAKSIHSQIEKTVTENFPGKKVRILSQGKEVK